MWRTDNDFYRVKQLAEQGLSDYKIAALTGVPRGTVRRWRRRDRPPHAGLGAASAADWVVADAATYCYLLGAYLGDGHITHRPPHGWSVRIACDREYETIIDEIRRAMDTTFPGRCSTRF